MRARDEIRLAIVSLLAIQVITSFGAIGLLGRMAPAVERILEENVYSITAVEQMLGVMASAPGPVGPAERERFDDALARASSNITEDAERPVLRAIEASDEAALRGDPQARRRLVDSLEELGEINRASMERLDAEAKRLGTAGAWGAAILGMLGLLLSVITARRLSRRLVSPLENLWRTVTAFHVGDPHQRAHIDDAPPEIDEVGRTINQLLDVHHESSESARGDQASLDRTAMLYMLDQRPDPQVVLDPRGEVVATNHAANALMVGERSAALRMALRGEIRSGEPDPRLDPTPLRDRGWLLRIDEGWLAQVGD